VHTIRDVHIQAHDIGETSFVKPEIKVRVQSVLSRCCLDKRTRTVNVS